MPEFRLNPSPDVCDFCSAPNPTWIFDAETFTLTLDPRSTSIGAWTACDECAGCINRDAWNQLSCRSIATPYGRRLAAEYGEGEALSMIYRLHKQFRANRKGLGRYTTRLSNIEGVL